MSMLRLVVALVCSIFWNGIAQSGDEAAERAKDGNRLAYLDECNPWYPHKDFPKLITPQWVGEEGVEAVIVLGIDDMRDPAKYEHYLRPILNRLKQIDGRAPVSIMTNEVKPDDPQLQSWLGEGLSIECHTIDHPCPILQGGDGLKKVSGTLEASKPAAEVVTRESSRHLFEPAFAKAKSTYDRCVDLMGKIPGNNPVAFRTPCCDSLNTVSPRFFSEIFDSTTENENFLQIDSSVFTFFTSEDESLPKELVLDANGNERFWKYLPKNNKYGGNVHNNFVNYIKNYPYPYVINNSCWEIPCLAPSDWSAQHLHGANNPTTVEDWKAAIDLTVHKQGCFSLVFHPHGWISPEQVVEMIDHAVAKHGKKVKFLNFREVAKKLNGTFFFGTPSLPDAYTVRTAGIEGIRLVDMNRDRTLDVFYGSNGTKTLSGTVVSDYDPIVCVWDTGKWNIVSSPFTIASVRRDALVRPASSSNPLFFSSMPGGLTSMYQPPSIGGWVHGEGPPDEPALSWVFGTKQSTATQILREAKGQSVGSEEIAFARFVDLDQDGISEVLGKPKGRESKQWAVFSQRSGENGVEWHKTKLNLSGKWSMEDLIFVDLDQNGILDPCHVVYGSIEYSLTTSLQSTWDEVDSFPSNIPGITRYPAIVNEKPQVFLGGNGGITNNGFFIRDRHFCWINEDTAHLPDLMYRVSFDEILAEHKHASASGGRQPAGTTTANAPEDAKYRGADAAPLTDVSSNEPVPIGAAVVDITPEYPVRLTGYGNRMKESEGVAAKIHARALVIGGLNVAVTLRRDEPTATPRDSLTPAAESQAATPGNAALVDEHENQKAHHAERDGYVILLTVDNCGVPIEITETVFERIAARRQISRERFAISSTHSHSAPWLRGFAPNIFDAIPDDHAAHLAQYETELIEKLVEVVDKAIAARRPGHLSSGFGEAGFAMNRRLIANGKWTNFGEVPDGATDKRVPVLAAHDTEGKLIAVLANYACHCTTETGEFNQISGDWAGYAADMLEADHPGAVALIAIGCGADANPSPRGTHEQAKVHGRTMADEVTRILASGRASALRGNDEDKAESGERKAEENESGIADGGLTPNRSPESAMSRINPDISCNMARIDLPLGPLPSRADWEQQATQPGVTGSRARHFLKMLDDGQEIPSTIPDYPVQTWCFGDDLAMVFLGGEVVVDYSIRMNDMFDSDRLWINAYSNDVPCYIASARVLREGGYEADSSMFYYRQPTRLAPEAEDVLCDAVQKLMPHEFYSEALQRDFPAPKSPEESLKCMTTKPDLRVVLAASEPLIRDPVAFDWDERGRLWVVEMGDYPEGGFGIQGSGSGESQMNTIPAKSRIPNPESSSGRVQILEDTDKDGVYDKATTFLDGLAFPNGIHCWRGGVIITMAPEIFYAEDSDGDGKADVRETLYQGFVEGNQQHRVNGLRWGLDGWLYLANGDSGGEIVGTGFRTQESGSSKLQNGPAESRILNPESSPLSLRGRDLRIHPDTNGLDTVSGQTQFGRERDDFGNWFGNNNSNPIYQYVLEDRYVRRNPHAGISQVTAQVATIPGAAPVYPTSRTLARFNDFAYANRFTSACSTMIYRDNYLGEQYYGNAFTSEPVHNLVSRLVLTRHGYGFKGERAVDEQESEFLASTDNWFRPTMIRTGPDGAIWVADMYRAVIEHPEWIPPEYQRKMNLYAGNDRGRIYRIVPTTECCGANVAVTLRRDDPSGTPRNSATPVAEAETVSTGKAASADESERTRLISTERDGYFDQPWNEIPIADLVKRLESPNGWWRDTAQRILLHRRDELQGTNWLPENWMNGTPQSKVQSAAMHAAISDSAAAAESNGPSIDKVTRLLPLLKDSDARVRQSMLESLNSSLSVAIEADMFRGYLQPLADDEDTGVRLQLALVLGEISGPESAALLSRLLADGFNDPMLRSAVVSSLSADNIEHILHAVVSHGATRQNDQLVALLIEQSASMGKSGAIAQPLRQYLASMDLEGPVERLDRLSELLRRLNRGETQDALQNNDIVDELGNIEMASSNLACNSDIPADRRAAAVRLVAAIVPIRFGDYCTPFDFLDADDPVEVQIAGVELAALPFYDSSGFANEVIGHWDTFAPVVREAATSTYLRRESTTQIFLNNLEQRVIQPGDLSAIQRDQLMNHSSESIASRAKRLLADDAPTARAAVVDDFKSQISNLKSDAVAGKAVFEKRCSACHRLQDIGKEIGADLAALKDRSTEALLTAVLDPNRAVESKFLVYTVVTKDGLQHSGMLKGETGGSLTLIGSDGKEITVVRADIEELVASKRSLMPEGLEKDIAAQDLANVFAFVQSTGTPWKRFAGNSPQFVAANADGTVTLSASAAEIYGPNLVFEEKYGNLGFWSSTEDYAKWTFEVPKSGHWTVEFDFACDNATAGSLIKFSTGNRLLTARVPGSGTWDNYQTWQAGTIDLHRGRGQLIITAPENPPFALIDLRAIKLIPPK